MRFISRIPRWSRAGVALLLLAILALNLDWSALSAGVQRLDWPLVAVAMLLYPVQMLLNAAKWSAALRLHDLPFRFGYLLRTGCIGFFVNNLLPSAIGGDVYRVYRSSMGGATSQAVSAVVLERFVGLAVLLLNGLIGAALLFESSSLARIYLIWCLAGLVVAALFAGLVAVCHQNLASRIGSVRRLQPLAANFQRIARRHAAWVPLVLFSVAFQLAAAAAMFVALLAVGADVTIAAALLITVAAGLAAVLPISISGIGVVEGSIVGAGVALGVDYDSAFLAALLLRGLSLATSLGCGIVYVFEGGRRSLQTA
jgi:glycosyltransferase 2 family protein